MPQKRSPRANTRAPSRRRVVAAFTELLAALGTPTRPELKLTPTRAAALWLDHLIAGEGADLAAIVGKKASLSSSRSPVSLFNIGVHLVCPHHLTVAFGHAHIAYVPNGRVVGFGPLARLVAAATSRLSLQEDVTDMIANALMQHLGASAAVAVIEAVHPCHNVTQPRSHRAHVVTWAVRGPSRASRELRQQLNQAIVHSGLKQRS